MFYEQLSVEIESPYKHNNNPLISPNVHIFITPSNVQCYWTSIYRCWMHRPSALSANFAHVEVHTLSADFINYIYQKCDANADPHPG